MQPYGNKIKNQKRFNIASLYADHFLKKKFGEFLSVHIIIFCELALM